jgi:CPA2 family monovalent cation:H+ antiporter-2
MIVIILGKAGLSLNLLTSNQYSLILAASLISITFNPFMYKLIQPLEKLLDRLPVYRKKETSRLQPFGKPVEQIKDHVIIVGYDRVGKHMVDVLTSLNVPLLVVEDDVDRISELNTRKIPTLFGDASNSEVLNQTNIENARVIVSTIPDETATSMIVTQARDLAPHLSIVARSATQEGVGELARLGANYIVQPELEGGLELLHHTLLELGFPLREVHEYAQAVRRDHYNLEVMSADEHRTLDEMLLAFEGIEISWVKLTEESRIIGVNLADVDIRAKTGASVVALIREGILYPNPKSLTEFKLGDRLGLIGEEKQIEDARKMIFEELDESEEQ